MSNYNPGIVGVETGGLLGLPGHQPEPRVQRDNSYGNKVESVRTKCLLWPLHVCTDYVPI